MMSGAKLSDTLNIFNNNGVALINSIPKISPAIVTSTENFLDYLTAVSILFAPSSLPIIIDEPIAIQTAVIIKKFPVVLAI